MSIWPNPKWTRGSLLATRAGVDLWEKPFVNMRASAVTDAADKFSGHVCEAWFGHSEAIANRHYRQVTEEHFRKAILRDQQAGGPVSEATQDPTYSAPVKGCKASRGKGEDPAFTEDYEALLTYTCVSVPPRGVEGMPDSSGETHISESGGAESGAVDAGSAEFPPDLGMVIKAWPHLSEDDRRAVLDIVREAMARAEE